ncbi:fused DSP-PTPase phosphatase/NAD kinase-like protein [Oceanibium sediminis]|uniref:fused DSP-PTPase phosphatase/NAD kinase-like protein n=1 Tax=Oceanibium sediminis TaxID=2026339 RepID=UPI000DD377E7|nr:sulfur transferase domain-containing protein [Oceanibium sediminis]
MADSWKSRKSAWRDTWRHDLDAPGNGWRATWDMMLHDHGLLRRINPNFATVAPGIWRMSQPGPRELRRLARRGLRTVVNLRGANEIGSYALERRAADALGLTLIDCPLRSNRPPTVAEVLALDEVFRTAERPLLVHCKSGADRAGLASALYLLLNDAPVAQARAQLSLRFLHFSTGKTGILDHFIDAYATAQTDSGIAFRDWLTGVYDPAALAASFTPTRLGDLLVSRLLARE